MKKMYKILILLVLIGLSNAVFSQNYVIPGNNIRIDATYENISIYWDISGDDNFNSTLIIEFKKTTESVYKPGAVTMRARPDDIINNSPLNKNFHAGSAMFLEAGTMYDLKLTLSDPDGGGTVKYVQAKTKTELPQQISGSAKYVIPGNGGGTGTSTDPYQGLQAAANAAQPGDVFSIAPGTYTPFSIKTDGTSASPIVFSGSKEGSVIIDGNNTDSGVITLGVYNDSISNIIIENLVIQNGKWGIDAQNSQNITVRNCIIRDVDYGYTNRREKGWEHDQTISDCKITGRTTWPQTGGVIPPGRGINIIGNNNVVRFNEISFFGDGITTDATPYKVSYSLDIHNNLIHHIVDDLIEVDGMVSNTRVWRNKCSNGRMGISLAPVFGGPCYVVRNQFMNMESSIYKMNRQPSGLVVVHNSGAKINRGTTSAARWENTFFRNNVLASTEYCFEEYGLSPTSLIDDWDYNAYSSDRAGVPGAEWFKWNNIRYANVDALFAGTGIEEHGISFNYHTDLVNITLPAAWTTPVETFDFTPTVSAPFINSGENLANLNNPFVSDGMPDCGAIELGMPLPVEGPRTPSVITSVEENFIIQNINVYPNPVSDALIIECKGNKERLSFAILNSIGQIVSKGELTEKTILQTSKFLPGVYLIKFENGRTFDFKKIVKK